MRGRITAIAASLVACSGTAFAQSTDACISAFEEGQSLRDSLALREAQKRFTLCSQEACPAMLRADCVEAHAALLHDLPSIVPGARRTDGSDIGDLSITVDGAPVSTPPGASIGVDPGRHVVRFESPGFAPSSLEIVVRIGERNRPVLVTMTEAPQGTTAPPTSSPERRRSPWVLPLAGIGIAAMGSFAYFGINGLNDRADASRCAPSCPPEDASRVRTQFIVADVSLAVGVIALVAATVLYFDFDAPARQTP